MNKKLLSILDKKKKINLIISLTILFVLIITIFVSTNSKVKMYINDKTAFCSGKFPDYVCVDKDGDPISGIMYSQGSNELTFKNGKLNGISKWYDEDNKLAIEENYKNGKLNGISKWYDEDNKLEENYKDGELNGTMKIYRENDQLMGEINYKDGELNGTMKYYENGKLGAEMNYKDGKIDSIIRYDEKGQSEAISPNEVSDIINKLNQYEFIKNFRNEVNKEKNKISKRVRDLDRNSISYHYEIPDWYYEYLF